MRRKDREITEITEIIKIIKNCATCSVALIDGEYPYVVPLNFGMAYIDGKVKLYMHCAKEGKKLDLIKSNSNAAFEMSTSKKLITGDLACDYTMEFESVCGRGKIRILNKDEKVRGLKFIMSQYGGADKEIDEKYLKAVEVLELTADEISGKRLRKDK